MRLRREAFLREFGAEVQPALRRERAGMGKRDMEVFRGKRECYSAHSEAGFATRTLGDGRCCGYCGEGGRGGVDGGCAVVI